MADLNSKWGIINGYSGNVKVVPKGHWSDSLGFPELNLSWTGQIELIWMTLGIVKINSCVTSKLPIIKEKLPCDNIISCRQIFTAQITNHQFFKLNQLA